MRAPYNVAISINQNKYKIARLEEKTNNLAWFEISKGELSNATEVNATIDPEGYVQITWEGTEEWKLHNNNDYLVAAVYNKTRDTADTYLTSQQRTDQAARIPLNEFSEGDVLEIFVYFHVHQFKYITGSKANVSNSKWVGQFKKVSEPLIKLI
ncbi:MAG TPA: DUF6266 family protein [Lentimicrobium sp.]|nr:DUF6266 family protein [Lentimicrobium sp.]